MRVCVCLVNYNKWIYVKPNLCQYHIYLITQQPNSGQDLFVTGWAENNLFGISELIFRMGEVGFNPINSIPHTESQKKGQWQIFFHKLHNFISCNFNRLQHCNSYLAYNFPAALYSRTGKFQFICIQLSHRVDFARPDNPSGQV